MVRTNLSYAGKATTPDMLKEAYLERARAIAPLIEEEAEEIERQACVTDAVFRAVGGAGLYWMLVPTELGGGGLRLADAMEVLEEISRADASTGWSLMANSICNGMWSATLDEPLARTLFFGAKPANLAGQFVPTGEARVVEGGYQVHGRYQFASGSGQATHLLAMFKLLDDAGRPRLLENGSPEAVLGFFPRERVNMLGNWDVMGLVGTGSFDYQIPDQVLPTAMSVNVAALGPKRGGGAPFFDGITYAGGGHSGVVLGIMKRALQEVVRLTENKRRPDYTVPVIDHPVFQYEFSKKEAAYRSARAYVLEVYAEAEAYAEREGRILPEHVARMRQSGTWVHTVLSEVVEFCHRWAGTSAIRNPSALGRCTRDAAVATQHMIFDPASFVTAAPALLDHYRR